MSQVLRVEFQKFRTPPLATKDIAVTAGANVILGRHQQFFNRRRHTPFHQEHRLLALAERFEASCGSA